MYETNNVIVVFSRGTIREQCLFTLSVIRVSRLKSLSKSSFVLICDDIVLCLYLCRFVQKERLCFKNDPAIPDSYVNL